MRRRVRDNNTDSSFFPRGITIAYNETLILLFIFLEDKEMMERVEAMANEMSKIVVLAIVVLAAMFAIQGAHAGTSIEETFEETIEYENEETIIRLGENQAIVVDCDYEEQDLRIYTVEYRTIEDYEEANDNYLVIGIRRIDMSTGECYLDWVSPMRR